MSTMASEESSDFEHPMASEPRWSRATLEQLFRVPSGFGAMLEQLFRLPSGLGSTLEQLFRAPSGLGSTLEQPC